MPLAAGTKVAHATMMLALHGIRWRSDDVWSRRLLGALLAFGALNAFAGGYYGMTGAPGVPVEWLAGGPFTSYVVPGLILFVVVGGTLANAAVAVFSRGSDGPWAAYLAGAVALGWLAVPVAIIGFPLGFDLPMDRPARTPIAQPSLTAGTVSKLVEQVLQVDGYGAPGSSGSPIFDRSGRVIGVLFGGERASQGRLIYGVPVSRVRQLLGASGELSITN